MQALTDRLRLGLCFNCDFLPSQAQGYDIQMAFTVGNGIFMLGALLMPFTGDAM